MINKIYSILTGITKEIKRKNISSFAAGAAFFFFVALVPMLIVICSLIPFTPIKEESMILTLLSFVPEFLQPLIRRIIADVYERNAGVLSLALLATIWSAGKAVLGLMRGLDEINEVEEKRNYFSVRLIASCYTLITIFVFIGTLVVVVFGHVFVNSIITKIPNLKTIFVLFGRFRVIAFWGVLTLFFASIYTHVPERKAGFRRQVPGAMISAVAWSVFSWLFSLYVKNSSLSTYGSLSLIIFVLLWLYFGIYIILIGAFINKYFKQICHIFRYFS